MDFGKIMDSLQQLSVFVRRGFTYHRDMNT